MNNYSNIYFIKLVYNYFAFLRTYIRPELGVTWNIQPVKKLTALRESICYNIFPFIAVCRAIV